MSYTTPQYASPGEPVARPSTVTAASLSLYAMAVFSLLSAVVGIISMADLDAKLIEDIYRQSGADEELAGTMGAFAMAVIYATVGLSVILAVVYAILGLFVGKGKNWARITAWVFGGLAICCGAVGAVGGAAGSSLGGSGSANGMDAALAEKLLAEAMPSWVDPVNLTFAVITLLLALVVVITLALPASNAFFRRPEPEWVPPTGPVA